ncbi:Shedu anti-phage system protein SduA domain-containing protein [Kitasatospora sp. NPDC058046]|uniref:Shedu anti-phage system protein SduA domain-containing protein n=1 Tax=Kitasatospora sp. NPDC058046 TaxID=3346312 RepID=UPI0036DDB6AB
MPRRRSCGSGVPPQWIESGPKLGLPGLYGGVSGGWDIIISRDGFPLAAIYIKSAAGPSFGNNFRNRIQEITEQALDVRRQYERSGLKDLQPHLGLLFILEDCPESRRPVKATSAVAGFPSKMNGISYRDRFAGFFGRLLKDRVYDGICYVTSTPDGDSMPEEPCWDMGVEDFLSDIVSRVSALSYAQDQGGMSSASFGEALSHRDDIADVMTGFTSTPTGLAAAEMAVVRRRRMLVAELRDLALQPDASETAMHKAMGGHYWLFGGQYTGVAARRDLMNLDEHDFPLVCSDGSLHIIELKGPEAPLVRRARENHLIVTSAVHEAVSQCMNYLRTIDEMGAALRTLHNNELGLNYDYRRARGTVVIGFQERAITDRATREQIDQTIRSYNSHLSRIQVLTYADLLDSAERALRFEETSR